MPEPPDARRTVSASDIARLAEWFDRFQYADDPNSAQCKEAEIQFNSLISRLYEDCVRPYYHSITLSHFRGKVVSECKRYLNRQQKETPQV
jgi:hypothetical protein